MGRSTNFPLTRFGRWYMGRPEIALGLAMGGEKPRKTSLYAAHIRAGAQMIPFAGFWMPLRFEGVVAEHLRVRSAVGLFDVSHMGEIVIKGPKAQDVVQRLLTNDVASIPPGKAVYSPACLPSGGIVDDLIAYKFSSEHFLVCVNAANRQKDFRWFTEQAGGEGEVVDLSDDYTQVAVQGPKAPDLLARVFGDFVNAMKPFSFQVVSYQGYEVILATTGYTGERGGEIYFPNEVAETLWTELLDKGRDLGAAPIGLGARDTLRLEMVYCLYGHDIDETTTPLEAGIGWTVKFDKGYFIGRDALMKQREEGLSRRLVAFVMEEKGVPRQGYRILADGEVVGAVTSGAYSPSLGAPVGLGYVAKPHDAVGNVIGVDLKGMRTARARVVEPPLFRRGK